MTASIYYNSPFCRSPLQAEMEIGDIILRVDDTLINSGQDFAQAVAGKTYMQVPMSATINYRLLSVACVWFH